MNARQCGPSATRDRDRPSRPTSHRRRGLEIAGWIIPSATLALLPKCPACVAMYVALFSGVSVSFASASIVRTSLLVLSLTALFCLALMRLCWLAARNRRS